VLGNMTSTQLSQRHSVQAHTATPRCFQTCQGMQQCCLAGAVGTKNSPARAWRDRQGKRTAICALRYINYQFLGTQVHVSLLTPSATAAMQQVQETRNTEQRRDDTNG